MRVIFRMRAAAPANATRGGAILAVSAVCAALALSGCGQRGALYMPTVPPLPAKPAYETQDNAAASPNAASDATATEAGSIPDTSGTPLSLSPDTELSTTPTAPASPQAASSATPTQ
jgi:predicted small lipoprotein YifL